jgi:hypothetical protein
MLDRHGGNKPLNGKAHGKKPLEIARNIRTLKTDLKEPEWKNVKGPVMSFCDETDSMFLEYPLLKKNLVPGSIFKTPLI